MFDLRKVFVSTFVLVLVSLCAIPAHAAPQAPPQVDVVATGLSNPRGIAFGPDGAAYVSNFGIVPGKIQNVFPDGGQVLRIELY